MGLFNDIANTISPGSIDAFKSSISKRQGLAIANRFVVFMSPPSGSLFNFDIQEIGASLISGSFDARSLINDPRDIGLLCDGCSIPGRQIQSLDYSLIRQTLKVPNGYTNDDITFSFHLTNDYYIKKIFDKWSQLVIDPVTYKLNYRSVYKRDITIQQLNEKNIPVYGIKLKSAHPVAVSSIDMNSSAIGTTQKLNVTFTYDDFEPEGALTSSLSGIKNAIGGISSLF
jgi:hypothetical protein